MDVDDSTSNGSTHTTDSDDDPMNGDSIGIDDVSNTILEEENMLMHHVVLPRVLYVQEVAVCRSGNYEPNEKNY